MNFWLPAPESFSNRYLSNGGGGWSVSGANSLMSGLPFGAASGATDGGFGSSGLTAALLMAGGNGTIAWSRWESFSYQAIHEMTVTGKELTRAFYNVSATDLKSYYLGCSEGGREGHQSTQRYPKDFDGVMAGAPAMYWPVHQLAQGWPNIAMAQANHWPNPCAFNTIRSHYIAACDPLDGLTDGVISRSELCTYDPSKSVGVAYANCSLSSGAPGATAVTYPAGTISQADADVVKAIYKGGFTSAGDQLFWAYRPGTTLTVEAGVKYNAANGTFSAGTSNFFGTYYTNMVLRTTASVTVPYDTITVDDVYDMMLEGLQQYGGWSESTWPDLSAFQANGGKMIHYHGEQDTNLFPEASAHFHEKVRAAMFPGAKDYTGINEFYRFYLVPGAAHCSINTAQPNGPWPQFGFAQLIDWVENGVAPSYLNGTTETGTSIQSKICLWPTRPLWKKNSTSSFDCVEAKAATTFIHPLNGWKVDY